VAATAGFSSAPPPTDAPSTAPTSAAPVASHPAGRPAPKKRPASTGTSHRSSASGNAGAAQALLDQINAWRADAGLRPYRMLAGLVASAHKHNLRMAGGCGLSHRCSGEADLGDRIHAEGVNWMGAGENCGVGGGVGSSTAAITESAKGLNQSMFDEKPPNDGHRQNLLSSGFTQIGIDVVRDSKGNVWLTEDFVSN